MPSRAEADIRIEIARCILEIERKRSRVRAIVPIATTHKRKHRRRSRGEIRIQDTDFAVYSYLSISILAVVLAVYSNQSAKNTVPLGTVRAAKRGENLLAAAATITATAARCPARRESGKKVKRH